MTKELEQDSKFPVKPKTDIIREELSEGERTLEQLQDKEKHLFKRIYPFTPKQKLCEKFGISSNVHDQLVKEFKDNGELLHKDESYSRSVVAADPKKNAVAGKSPSHMLSAFLNTVSEEERRELLLMKEEGLDPIGLLEELIIIQSTRILRGQAGETGPQLSKTMNEAMTDSRQMIKDLHEMKEGVKNIHGFDDSFVGLLLALQKKDNRTIEN